MENFSVNYIISHNILYVTNTNTAITVTEEELKEVTITIRLAILPSGFMNKSIKA